MTPTLANSTSLSLPRTWQKLLKSRMACSWDARGAWKTISTNQPFDDQPLDTINLSVISFWCRCYKCWTDSTGILMILNWFACIFSIKSINSQHQSLVLFPVTCCTIWDFSILSNLPRVTWAPTWCLITGLGCVDHIRSMMFVKTSICPSPKFSRHQSKVWHDNMAI